MDDLKQKLQGFSKLAVIGIGSELKSDDAVGIHIIQKLKTKIKNEMILILEGGTTPENVSGVLRKFGPSHILMIDAASMGKAPGSVTLIDPGRITGAGFSTHTFSLATIAGYFKEITGAVVLFLGIEPESVTFGEGLSPAVQLAAERVEEELAALLP